MMIHPKCSAIVFIPFLVIMLNSGLHAQSTRKYEYRVQKLFNLELSAADFRKGKVFLTLDTINAQDPNIPSNYIQTYNPDTLVKCFKGFMKSIKIDGNYYHYYELFNSPFYESPLHLSYFINTDVATYHVEIWTDKDDTEKIEGLTVSKMNTKIKKSDD